MGKNDTLFNPLIPGAFCRKCFLDILVVFRLDLSQISFNLVENTFATRQLTFFCHYHRVLRHLTRARTEINILRFLEEKVAYVFRLFDFWICFFFFSPFFFSFSFLFAAVIDLLLGLLAVKKLLRKRHRDGQLLPWSSQVWWQQILV